MKSKNKQLTDMLERVRRNYEDLMQLRVSEGDMIGCKRKNIDEDCLESIGADMGGSWIHCGCGGGGFSPHGMPKLQRSKVSRVFVRINPSDVSLVSFLGFYRGL